MTKGVLSTFEAAKYCRVNPYTVRNWIEAGKLPAYTTPGGHRRVRKEDLDAFLRAHGMPLPEDFSAGAKRILVADAKPRAGNLRRYLSRLSDKLEVRDVHDPFGLGWALLDFRPHLLLLAVDMPGLDSGPVLRRLRKHPETSSCRVLATVAEPAVEVVEAALGEGALECFVRPVDLEALVRLLREIFPYAIPRSGEGR